MVNPKTKGGNGEREACTFLGNIVGIDLTRNLEQTRSGGGDILGIEGLTIEVKRQETLNVKLWWAQVCRAADSNCNLPVLMYRQNRKQWLFCLPSYLLVLGAPDYITLGERDFEVWLSHWVQR